MTDPTESAVDRIPIGRPGVPAVPAGQAPATERAGVAAVRALHQPMSRAGFLICAHCSGWNGVRCLGVVADYPCPTIAALDETASAVAVRRATDETPGEAGRTVAYQSNGGSLLRCIAHAPEWAAILCGDFHPVTSDDLPDGGICTMPDCGADVLIPQQPKEARP